ncbi:Hsp33 family molecular chaperone HslO [Pseudomaricurvus alcaniphilus]|uniref:Hsp33 family molecular chaperone HslO n=1 Tax=Pseudomaricurvus alcaniphilus TaxID=1166482 RepID=UPI001409B07C|nr:Hsp33 family molecular chaperone HslO [Pseudomaricurvus alcaniphilus]NHN38723.1 Hsp33 family molecular chaperone HslO [Pseudomaricurvus alcaniphilus]
MPSSDLIHRFIFDKADLRGEISTLQDSYGEVLQHNSHLPERVKSLLGEFLAAVTLLSGTLKFDGILTLQARGDGPLTLVMAECSHHRAVRAIARLDPDADDAALAALDMQALLGSSVLAIIIEPDKGERYQGIVPLDGGSLAACLEQYFARSEQLPTRFWLASDGTTCTGMMLQALPRQVASVEANQQLWETATVLADTVKQEELLSLPHGQLLHRLFHEQEVRLFEPAAVHFACSCSRERSANALVSLGRAEVEALLVEQDMINIDCQFCNRSYAFGAADLDQLFGPGERELH